MPLYSEAEFVEGYGSLKLTEPTTLCDIANTLGYVQKVTPAVEKVEKLLEEMEYYTGTYDEEGRFKAGCLRNRHSYSWLTTPEESNEWTARSTLGYQLWDAHVEYSRLVPELGEKLKALREELGNETDEMAKRGEFK